MRLAMRGAFVEMRDARCESTGRLTDWSKPGNGFWWCLVVGCGSCLVEVVVMVVVFFGVEMIVIIIALTHW